MSEKVLESIIIKGILLQKITNDYTEYYVISDLDCKKTKILSRYERLESLFELFKEMLKNG